MTAFRQPAASTAGKTQRSRSTIAKLVIPFEDNRLLVELLGEYDAHLSLIEERLDVDARVDGNVVTLEGPQSANAMAKDVLEHLYARLRRGERINRGDVDGAIRHAERDPRLMGGGELAEPDARTSGMAVIQTRRRTITARTPRQSAYIRALQKHDLVFGIGPAGTGKTYLAVIYGAAMLERGDVDRIILSRPAVEAGEKLGYLPGDMREKVDPYLRPLYDALHDVMAPERVAKGIETGQIEVAPLAFMRGRTLAHSFVILDEAQNCSPTQMKMFLTRLGEGSKMVITGDPSQIDLPSGQRSGLHDAVEKLRGVQGIEMIAFDRNDVVRRDLVGRIVAAYENAE